MASLLKVVVGRAPSAAMVPLVGAKLTRFGGPFLNVQCMGIKTKSSAKKRFLRRANGTVKRWKAGRRHLNYNQSRQKLNKSLSSQELKKPDRKVVWKLLGGKK